MAASSGAIKAGRAFVELFADPSKLTRTLEAAKKRVLAFGRTVATVGLAGAGAGLAALGPLAKMFGSAANEGAGISKLAKSLNAPVEEVSRLKNALAEAGIAGDEAGQILQDLNSKVNDATTNYAKLWEAATAPRGADLYGKGPEEQLEAIFAAFEHVNEADQMDVAKKLGMENLLEYLKKGKAGLEELRAAGAKNNVGWDAAAARDAETVMKEFEATSRSVKSTLLEIGKSLLPAGADFASFGVSIRETIQSVREWIRENGDIIKIVAAVAGGVLIGGGAVAAFGGAVALAAPIIGGLIIAIKAVVAIVGVLLSPLGLALVAVTAIAVGIGYLVTKTEAGQEAFANLKNRVGEAFEFIKSTWAGISDALRAGNWSLAFEIGVQAASVAWKQFVLMLTEGWVRFKDIFVDTWQSAVDWLAKAMVSVAEGVVRAISAPIRKLVEGYNEVAGFFSDSAKLDASFLPGDEEIKKTGKAIRDEITSGSKIEADERHKFRQDQIDRAKAARDVAKEELEALKKQAAEEAAAAGNKLPVIDDTSAKKNKPPSFMQTLGEAAKGIFSGPAQQSLGYGDALGQRQLDAANNTASNTAAALTVLEQIRDKPGGIVLK